MAGGRACGLAPPPSPPLPSRGRGIRAPHRRHALLSQSGHFKERSSPREEKSGSGARGLASQKSYGAGYPCPPGMLALPGGDAESFHRATSVRARSSGLITQPRHLRATEPVPPPSPDPWSGPGFPRGRCEKYRSGERGVNEQPLNFLDILENQWLGRRIHPRGIAHLPRGEMERLDLPGSPPMRRT